MQIFKGKLDLFKQKEHKARLSRNTINLNCGENEQNLSVNNHEAEPAVNKP